MASGAVTVGRSATVASIDNNGTLSARYTIKHEVYMILRNSTIVMF